MAFRFWLTALPVALAGTLAWADDGPAPPEKLNPDAAIAASRDMLDLLGAGDRLAQVTDVADFSSDDEEALWRFLTAVRRFRVLDVERWKLAAVTPEELSAEPAKYRGAIVSFSGTITDVDQHELPSDAADRFDLQKYFRCHLTLADGAGEAIVYALDVPKEWFGKGRLEERASVQGMFVRLADNEREDGTRLRPVLVAQRVAWYPRTMLGDLEMDVGLFDELSEKPELAAEDRECFYQLLAAVGRTGPRQLSRAVPKEGRDASVIPLFKEPATQRGRLVELTGTARQALLRRVEDPDIVARFGIDHYYEMEIFTPDSQDNPLVFCVRDLPPGFPDRENIIEPVRVAGFFLKRWGYRSSPADSKTGRFRRQLAPLLIGREPIWIEPPQVDQRFANGVFLVLFVVLTGVLWLVVSHLSRGDAKFHKHLERRFGPVPPESLNEIGLDQDGPM